MKLRFIYFLISYCVIGIHSEELLLEDFEHCHSLRLTGVKVDPASVIQIISSNSWEGSFSAKLDYKFEQTDGLQYLEIIFDRELPQWAYRFSIAIWGDGSGNIVRVRLIDNLGEYHQYDLGVLYFRGWKILETNIEAHHSCWGGDQNGRLDLPLRFYSIILDSIERPSSGTVAFDAIYIYSKKPESPVDIEFVPTCDYGFFWGSTSVLEGELIVVCKRYVPFTLQVDLLNYKEKLLKRLLEENTDLDPPRMISSNVLKRKLSIPTEDFGVFFIDVTVNSFRDGQKEEIFKKRFSVCRLPKQEVVLDERIGVCTHFGQYKHRLPLTVELIKQMGVGWIRDELYWASIEKTQGIFEFPDYYNKYMEIVSNLGIRPLIIFSYGNQFYDNGLSPYTEQGREAFVRYCKNLVTKYGNICRHWEVWNEPNIGFWRPKPDPIAYTALLKKVYKEVKSIDPQAFIVGVCSAGIDFDFIEKVLEAQGAKYMEAISVHPYKYPRPPEKGGFIEDIERLNNLLLKYNAHHLKIWISEFGYPTHINGGLPEWLAAAFILRTCILAMTRPFIERIFIYDFQDDGHDSTYNEHNFGLIRADGFPKVGYAVIHTMVRMLANKQFVEKRETSPHIICLEFRDSKSTVWVSWAISNETETELNLPNNGEAIIVDMMGNERFCRIKDGKLKIVLGPEPVFICLREK